MIEVDAATADNSHGKQLVKKDVLRKTDLHTVHATLQLLNS